MEEFDKQKGKYIIFQSGNKFFGLDIQYVDEIIEFQPDIAVVPENEDYIKGLINLRGKIIPVVDVCIRFQQEPIPYNDRTCIIVVHVGKHVVGLIVESIAEVVEIRDENILPSPSVSKKDDQNRNQFVSGIGKVGNEVKLILDPERLLQDEDGETIQAADESE